MSLSESGLLILLQCGSWASLKWSRMARGGNHLRFMDWWDELLGLVVKNGSFSKYSSMETQVSSFKIWIKWSNAEIYFMPGSFYFLCSIRKNRASTIINNHTRDCSKACVDILLIESSIVLTSNVCLA